MEFMASLQDGADELKPSLFEILSEQQLAALLLPSLRYLLALATHRHPRYLIRALNSFDEIYATLSLLVERYYLRTYSSGFTENFYGLKRARVLHIKGAEVPRAQVGAASSVRETLQLRDRDVWANLAIMVGMPYLKRKLDEACEIYAPQATLLGPGFPQRDALPSDATMRQRLLYYYKWFLRQMYPSVNAAYYFTLLAFNLAYLFDGSKYHSPFFWLVGTRIRRMGQSDYQAIDDALNPQSLPTLGPSSRPSQTTSLFHPRTFMQTVYTGLLSSLKILLPTSIFALKFLEWWHASDFARQFSRKGVEGLELPPPIISGRAHIPRPTPKAASQSPHPSSPDDLRTLKASDTGNAFAMNTRYKAPTSRTTHLPILTVPAPVPDTSSSCPICTHSITTATASPYGYVYCYVCIHKWIQGTHERQEAFMIGEISDGEAANVGEEDDGAGESREGRWESGRGRCAVSGKRILGGTEGLRRVVV